MELNNRAQCKDANKLPFSVTVNHSYPLKFTAGEERVVGDSGHLHPPTQWREVESTVAGLGWH